MRTVVIAVSAAANLAIVAMTVLIWLAFYPPEWLQRRVSARATAS